MDVEILSRLQFALTIAFHYIYPPMSIGLGVCLVIMEGLWLKTGNQLYHDMAKWWTKVFGLIFALGVATGIVMEFEFGTNWAAYSRFVGDVFGSALAAEGIFAFFLESGFLALLLFGWDKIGPKMHFFATCMVALGAHFSALWIVIANSWMQTPAGFHLVRRVLDEKGHVQYGPDGQIVVEKLPEGYIPTAADFDTVYAQIVDFWALVFNPSSVDRLTHVLIGCWLTGAFLVMSVSAYYWVRGRHLDFAKAGFKIGIVVAAVMSLAQLMSGASSAGVVVKHQPAKLAAMEGLWDSGPYAPMAAFGWVDVKNKETYSLAIPGMLSFLVGGSFDTPVTGLNDIKPENEDVTMRYHPPIQIVFQAYHIMINIGMLLIVLAWGGVILWALGWLFDPKSWVAKMYLSVMTIAVIFPQIANQCGWYTAEVGRQPWIVYGLMKTSDGISKAVTADMVLWSLIMFTLIYALLFALFIYLLNEKIQHGPEHEEATDSTMKPIGPFGAKND